MLRTSESGNSLVLDVEGFMYDEEMMDDSSAEQLTEEVPSSSHFRIVKWSLVVTRNTTTNSPCNGRAHTIQELLEAVQVFINDCQVVE